MLQETCFLEKIVTKRLNFSKKYTLTILYLVSIAVKDYEVTRLLTEKGYFEDQFAYVKYILMVSEDEMFSWQISRGNPLAESIILVSRLKNLACTIPFISDERFSEKLKFIMKESLHYLPKEHSAIILDLITNNFPSLGIDTISNINFITNIVVKQIIEPIFARTRVN